MIALVVGLAETLSIHFFGGDSVTMTVWGLVLAIINTVVRPVLIFLTLPFTLVTLGLFLFVLNAFCLWLTSWLVSAKFPANESAELSAVWVPPALVAV